MSVKPIIEEIDQDVIDVINTQFVYSNTSAVPNAEDPQLSYERGTSKKGKILNSCVLYVDIRDSVALSVKHNAETMGKIYTAFTKAVIKAARFHKASTRNIIGDRVMVVFPQERCFTNAVECALSINHIASQVLNKRFANVDFQCGIGIDYGEIKIIKVGIQRNGTEKAENKGLVWSGYPANYASRLTDYANKTFTETYYQVTRYPINPRAIKGYLPAQNLWGLNSGYDPNAPLYLTTTQTVKMSETEFANSISLTDTGTIFTLGGKLISKEKKTISPTYPPILITEKVYKGLLAEKQRTDLFDIWKEQNHEIKNISGKVYGTDRIWKL